MSLVLLIALLQICRLGQLIAASSERQCAIVTKASPERGLGLFAGQEWLRGTLEVAIGVPVPMNVMFGTALVNYVEGLNDTHCLLAVGQTMLVNHATSDRQENVRKFLSFADPLYQFENPSVSSIDILYDIRTTVLEGEEFLTNYGGDDWLEDRGIPVQIDPALIVDLPGCPLELTRWHGHRLLAAQFIAAGTIIEVSRAILLPISAPLLEAGPLCELLWWPSMYIATKPPADLSVHHGTYNVEPWSENHSYALLLSGRGMLYGAAELGMENVQYEWTPEPCSLLRLVTFTAKRDIAQGEELVVAVTRIAHRKYVDAEFASSCMQ